MDAPPQHHPTTPNGTTAFNQAEESSRTIEGPQSTANIAKRKNKKKKQILAPDSASSASSSNCSCSTSSSKKGVRISRSPKGIRVGSLTTRSNVRLKDVDALGLPLGMSIAAVVAKVLERKSAAPEKLSVDYLCGICILAVRESLGNVFGDKFDNFLMNFETSFQSTLMTLRLISGSSQNDKKQLQRCGFARCSCPAKSNLSSLQTLKESTLPEATEGEILPHLNTTGRQQRIGCHGNSFEISTLSSHEIIEESGCSYGDISGTLPSHERIEDSGCPSGDINGPESFHDTTNSSSQCHTHSQMDDDVKINPMNRQLVLHDKQIEQQLACASPNIGSSMLSTIEKSVTEQTRSNELKAFEIGLMMKKLQLKERQLELSSNANILERWKFSMGISKASFKAEKFKTQLQDSKQVELLKNCLDFLVGGLIIMLCSLAYGTYVYSHRRIIEATEACSPYPESKSWWMPKSMATFNSSFQLLKCQVQVLSRMLFGILMIGAIAFLLIQRSAASSHHTMPITFILLLLGVACGYAGKFCIDTLGGSGNHWLIYWEALCSLHFFSSIFCSTLFTILHGPITVAQHVEHNPIIPYWMRRLLFYAALMVLPLLCGFMPFAAPAEWFDHFSDIFTSKEDD